MGTFRLLLVLSFAFTIASAQQSATDTFTVEGVVVNSQTGKPVPRALVQIQMEPVQSVLTGSEGEFSFTKVKAGGATITVQKPGYFGPRAHTQGIPGVVQAEIGPDHPRIVIKMAPEAVIWGHVTGRDDEPLEGAQVEVLGSSFNNRLRQMFPQGSVSTDEDGNYRIANLPAGRYLIRVHATSGARRILGAANAKSEEGYLPLYYPGSPDLASAEKIDLMPGQRLEASFSLTPVPAFRIAGAVVASGEWKQVYPPSIVDSMGQVLFTVSRFNAGSSTFEFQAIPAGSYFLRVGGQDQQDHAVFTEHPLVVSQTVTGLKVVLHPGVDIPVVVRTQFGKPRDPCSMSYSLPNGEAKQTDCSNFPAASVELISTSSTYLDFNTNADSPTDSSAFFGVHAVTPGTYTVRATATFGGYVQSVRCGSQDLLREPLVVPLTGSAGTIEVTVRDDAATLKVQVLSEKPLQQGLVVLVPDDELAAEPRVIGGGKVSEFVYSPLAPGAYKVFAFDAAEGVDYDNPEFLAKYESSAAGIRVAANDNASVAVNVIHTGE